MLTTLDRHGVRYLLVGGVAAIAHGATRPTVDLDCLPERSTGNLERLAAAMQELNARLRVGGLDDHEAAQLDVQIDADSLGRMEISTWRTDAGHLDILADLPDRGGRHLRYEDLAVRSVTLVLDGIAVDTAALADVIASKEWADRPKDRQALSELYEIRDRQRRDDGPRRR
jgi:hypothetical protein